MSVLGRLFAASYDCAISATEPALPPYRPRITARNRRRCALTPRYVPASTGRAERATMANTISAPKTAVSCDVAPGDAEHRLLHDCASDQRISERGAALHLAHLRSGALDSLCRRADRDHGDQERAERALPALDSECPRDNAVAKLVEHAACDFCVGEQQFGAAGMVIRFHCAVLRFVWG